MNNRADAMLETSNITNMTIVNNSWLRHSIFNTATIIVLSVVFTVVITWTILGNITVILAVKRTPALRACPSNILVANLAISDLLLGALVLPLSAMMEVLHWWPLPKELCYFWLVIDVLICTASIWGLVAIALDRYTATFYPLWYRTKHRLYRTIIYVTVVWVISAVTSIPPLSGFGGFIKYSYQEQEPPICALSVNINYAMYSSTMTFIGPAILLFILYGRILLEIRRRTQTVAKMKSMFKVSMQVEGAEHHQIEQKLQELEQEESTSSQNEESTSEICHQPARSPSPSIHEDMETEDNEDCSLHKEEHLHQSHSTQKSYLIKCESQQKISLLKSLTSKRKKDRKEERATKIMLTIMMFFIVCWLPFFIMYIVRSALSISCSDCIPLPLQSVLIWLGYINSAGNPILYAAFNRQFKEAFRAIWCGRLKQLKRMSLRRFKFSHKSDGVPDSAL